MVTIAGTLRSTARRVPDATALKFAERTYTYRALDAAADRYAAALRQCGLRKGDRLALVSLSSDHFVLTFYATLRLGAIFVPVNPASAPAELAHVLSDSGASIVVYDPTLAALVDATREGPGATDARWLALGPGATDGDLTALAADVAVTADLDGDVVETDDALILYTSGTTGKAKGALFDHHRTLWVAFNCVATCGMRVGDRFLHVAPLYHAAELCIMLVPGTMIGATHVVLPGFDPETVVTKLQEERITMFFGVPTMFQFMLRRPELATGDFSSWRTALFGAAPMPASAVEELRSALPDVALMQLCGQTEAGPGGIYADAAQVAARPDASGRQALPMTEARVVDVNGDDVSAGDVGELILRGETVMKGYWGRPEETAQAIRDGWLHTGDLVRVDDDGFMTVVDRLKDLIITGGRNVYSVEVENAIAAHPDVLDCAVVGRPHPMYGESIVAVVAPREGAEITLESLHEVCADQISSYKHPHEVVVGAIPRNPSGKVLKHEIRSALADRAPAGADA